LWRFADDGANFEEAFLGDLDQGLRRLRRGLRPSSRVKPAGDAVVGWWSLSGRDAKSILLPGIEESPQSPGEYPLGEGACFDLGGIAEGGIAEDLGIVLKETECGARRARLRSVCRKGRQRPLWPSAQAMTATAFDGPTEPRRARAGAVNPREH